jgi:hypothetical protein
MRVRRTPRGNQWARGREPRPAHSQAAPERACARLSPEGSPRAILPPPDHPLFPRPEGVRLCREEGRRLPGAYGLNSASRGSRQRAPAAYANHIGSRCRIRDQKLRCGVRPISPGAPAYVVGGKDCSILRHSQLRQSPRASRHAPSPWNQRSGLPQVQNGHQRVKQLWLPLQGRNAEANGTRSVEESGRVRGRRSSRTCTAGSLHRVREQTGAAHRNGGSPGRPTPRTLRRYPGWVGACAPRRVVQAQVRPISSVTAGLEARACRAPSRGFRRGADDGTAR